METIPKVPEPTIPFYIDEEIIVEEGKVYYTTGVDIDGDGVIDLQGTLVLS